MLPGPVRAALRPWWRRFFAFKVRSRGWIAFTVWLAFQCARHQKRAVIICRCGGLGDVICTLPISDEVRRRHPEKLLVFITAPAWRDVVVMSRYTDLVYANKWWIYPFAFPIDVKVCGLIETVYNARTTGEKSITSGTNKHLITDLAESCGFTVAPRLPRLCPSSYLIERTCVAYGVNRKTVGERLLIGINPGPNWRVKEWEVAKWQNLISRIHAEYPAVIVQFGTTKADGSSDYGSLSGVKSLVSRLTGEEIVALVSVCNLIISIDSGPVHVAGAVGTPVVGLFGPLNPDVILTREVPGITVFADVPCRFCHNRTPVIHWIDGCPNEIACMKTLEVERVFDAVKSMLAHSRNGEAKQALAAVTEARPLHVKG